MIHRFKLRWRRIFRKRKKQVEDIGEQADQLAERHFFKRLNRLVDVRRFVVAWTALLVALIGITITQTVALDSLYQKKAPVPGGTYTEGITGSFTNANPLYATGSVDSAVSRLLFASLLKYDQNNQLKGDLAERWEVDERGTKYTVYLRKDAQWHDGTPLTAQDVVFTYETIQKADAKSPLLNSWRGIKVEVVDDHTVTFTLPNALSSFPHSLTNGIVPKHKLEDIPLTQLRSVRFNNVEPVGSGPFKWGTLEVTGTNAEDREETIGLVANEQYYGGKPKLDRFIIRSFREENNMVETFARNEVDAISGLQTMPEDLKEKSTQIEEYGFPMTSQVDVFFRTSQGVMADQKVRQALVRSVSTSELINGLGYPVVASKGPLLKSHLGYNKDLVQLSNDVAAANALLDQAGWARGEDGIRVKDGKPLTFKLVAANTGENVYITQSLQNKWKEVGVNADITLMPKVDVQSLATAHEYDALLYTIALGPDPDVFPYWHSSQAPSPKLNFSEYKSTQADKALEAGRTRSDSDVRAVKYQPFLSAWQQDAPALALFQPRYLYVSHDKIFGLDAVALNTANDRYNNVENWMIRQEKVNK